jgi:MFS family permease
VLCKVGRGKVKKIHYGWVILFAGSIGVMGALGFGRFAYTPILPPMKEALSLTYLQMGFIGTANFIGYLCFALIGGYLATRISPRMVITFSLALVAIGLFLTGLSNSFASALIMRTLTGIGSAGANIPIMALASAWFAPKHRGLAAGLLVSTEGVALLLLGYSIPHILEGFPGWGWRICWFGLGGVTLLITLMNLFLIRNHPMDKNLQPIGAEAISQPAPAPSSSPVSWWELLGSRSLWHLAGVYLAFGFSYIIFMQFFSAFLTQEVGISTEKAGNYFMLLGGLSIFCGPIWGTVSDLLGRKYGLAIVFLVQGTSYLIFGLMKHDSGHLVSTILFGLTAWSIPTIMAAAIGDVVGFRLAPAALGMATIIFGIGQAISPPIAGKIADATGSFTSAFILAATVAFIGMVASLLMKKVSPKH